ncbi:MAG: acyltransferase family protein [Sphingorhabdus sp.]
MIPAARPAFNTTVHGARGLFAMMVFIYHVVNSELATFAFVQNSVFENYFLRSFKFGVELFFGISGFVIVGALARAPSVRSFLWDRVTRIYPLLWTTLIAISIVSLFAGLWMPPFTDWLLNFLAPPPFFPIPQVNPAAWSLGYEITFYALCALCWALKSRGGYTWLVVAILVGSLLIVLFPRAALMPAGILAATAFAASPVLKRLASSPGLLLLVFLIGWRLLDLASGGDIATMTPLIHPFQQWLSLALPAIAVAAIGSLAMVGLVNGSGLLSVLLRTQPLQWLGTISYSLYLWHPVVMGGLKAVMTKTGVFDAVGPGAQLLFAIVSLPPSLIVAHYSQRLIEVRLTRALRRIGPREGSGAAPATASLHPAS